MAEFNEAPADAPAPAEAADLGRQPLPADQALQRAHGASTTRRRTSTSGTIFGSLALLVLVIQIVTGIFLTMHYKPDAAQAFASVEIHHARRALGLARSATCTRPARRRSSSSSTCTCSAACSTARYRKPRELVWIFGCVIFLCLMAEAFMGYLLPWGQMSYWGAQVIVNLFARRAVHRPGPGAADPRRLRRRRRDAEPLLQPST